MTPPTPEDRTNRHIQIIAELADLAMQLARAAAAKTLATLTHESTAETEPDPKSRATAAKPSEHGVLFNHLAKTVQTCLTLEARLAGGTPPKTAGHFQPDQTPETLRADPRRTPLREAIHKIVENQPDRAVLRRGMGDRLDQELIADTKKILKHTDILLALCKEFGVELDITKLSDAQLGFPPFPKPASPRLKS